MTNHEIIFTNVYNTDTWGTNLEFLPAGQEVPSYKGASGYGSTMRVLSAEYIPFLQNFIISNNIKSVADLGCGDFIAGENTYNSIKNIEYTGYDVYKDMIDYLNTRYKATRFKFKHLDILQDVEQIHDADLYILKDVLQHWTWDEINRFLASLVKKNFKYILLSNACDIESFPVSDISKTGKFRPISATQPGLKAFNPIILFKWGEPGLFMEQPDGNPWIRNISELSIIIK